MAIDKNQLVLLLVAASGIGLLAMQTWLPSAWARLVDSVQKRTVWIPLCAAFFVYYLAALLCSTTYAGYLEHVEPQIASVSFILLKGAPLYHSLTSAQRYSTQYGPMAYLPFTLVLHVVGANVFSLKLLVFFANLGLLWLLWRCYRKLLDRQGASLVTTLVVAFLLLTNDYVFQVRGDILIIFAVALGLYAALSPSSWISAFLLALACGFAFDIKFSALFYFVPLYLLLSRKHGWRLVAWALGGAVIVALIPFLFPEISAAGYLEWLHQMAQRPRSRVEILPELKMLLLLATPVGFLFWQLAQKSRGALEAFLTTNRRFLLVLASCVLAVAIVASEIGAGPHHFMPFYPILGYLCADIYQAAKTASGRAPLAGQPSFLLLLWFWFAIIAAVPLGIDFSITVRRLLTSRSQANAVASDLEMVMANHSGQKMEMGYGNMKEYADPSYRLTYFRPALVFAGNPLTLDENALADMQLSHIDIPPSTLEYLRSCETNIWLIPKGNPPFALVNIYSMIDAHAIPQPHLFSEEFRQTFFQQYRKQGSSEYFDIWECKADSSLPTSLKDEEDSVQVAITRRPCFPPGLALVGR